ncbi:PH domain-containing protein [Actinoallomurus sp. NPDC052308]|uniref:PH domain-containing protein n=1 Tax=Actinoallomurus sp. NPDC052308 TaxID=3155530 RepID=UPI00341EA2C1
MNAGDQYPNPRAAQDMPPGSPNILPPGAAPGPRQGPPPPPPPAPSGPSMPSAVPIGARAEQAFDPPSGMTWVRVSPKLTWHRRIAVLLWALPVTIVGAFVLSRTRGLAGGLIWLALVLAACAVSWVVAELSYRSWGFAERADDLLVTHGFFVRHLVVVPYGRMQYVDVTAGLLEQWLGVATVRLHTAAAATDARIPGLPARDAAILRDRLAQKGESRSIGL